MKKIVSAVQWTAFIIAANLVAPLAIAGSFGMNSHDTMLFLQRTLFVLGLAGFLQATIGHKLPINEGPAGIWWGIFALYASLSDTMFGSSTETLRVLSFSLILCGIICILLSYFKILDKLSKLFTPMVVGTYLILLLIQLASEFLKGMMGVGYINEQASLSIFLISIVLVSFSLMISKSKKFGSFSVIFIIIIGWIVFKFLGITKPVPSVEGFFKLPNIFVFGMPKISLSMIPTTILVTLLLLTNMLASVQVVKNVVEKLEQKETAPNIKNTGIIMGLNQILSGVFSAIGPVPLSGAAGYITQTKKSSIVPFIMSNILIMIISLFLPAISFLSTLPTPVGYCAIFTIFSNMIGLSICEFDKVKDRTYVYKIIGMPIFIGAGLMFIPKEAFFGMSPIIISILSNGLVCGTVIALLVQINKNINRKKLK